MYIIKNKSASPNEFFYDIKLSNIQEGKTLVLTKSFVQSNEFAMAIKVKGFRHSTNFPKTQRLKATYYDDTFLHIIDRINEDDIPDQDSKLVFLIISSSLILLLVIALIIYKRLRKDKFQDEVQQQASQFLRNPE